MISGTRLWISHNSSPVPVTIFDPSFCPLGHSCYYSTEVAIASNHLNDDNLAAGLGRIDQLHLPSSIDQHGALIDVCLVRDLTCRQRGWLLKQRKGTDAFAASDSSVVRPETLLDKCDHARIAVEIAVGILGVLSGHHRIQPAQQRAGVTIFAGNYD